MEIFFVPILILILSTISPDRQVYFFYSFKDTEKEFRGNYAIYDVETKVMVAGGSTYMPKLNKGCARLVKLTVAIVQLAISDLRHIIVIPLKCTIVQ